MSSTTDELAQARQTGQNPGEDSATSSLRLWSAAE